MDIDNSVKDFEVTQGRDSGVRLDSELPRENRPRRFALYLLFNVLALVALVTVLYVAIERSL